VVFHSSVEHHGEEGHEVGDGARGAEDRYRRLDELLATPSGDEE